MRREFMHMLQSHNLRVLLQLARLTTLGIAVVSPLAWGQIGLALAPMRIELRMIPGSVQTGTLALSNDSSARVRVRAEALDFYIDATGTPQFSREFPQEASLSCRQWLSLNPMELEMEPGVQIMVRFSINVPSSAVVGGYHCGAGFTTMQVPTEPSNNGLRTAVRAISVFYPVLGNPPIVGVLKSIKLEPVADPRQGKYNVVVVIKNSGLTYFRPRGELEVLDEEGKKVESAAFQPLPVLPNREQRFLFPMKAQLEKGSYTFRARVDIGTNEIQEAKVVLVIEQRLD